MSKSVSGLACRCEGAAPETCVGDDEVVTQWSFTAGSFHRRPRERDQDGALSVVRGEFDGAAAFKKSVGRDPGNREVFVRHARVGDIRAAELAVVHTPGRFTSGAHTSVVHPHEDPLNHQDPDWPDDLSIRFDTCWD